MSGLSLAQRIAVWDVASTAVRKFFRTCGAREVSTAIRRRAPAIEPYIEPLTSEARYLATSPELAMKRLLAFGSGDIYQIAHVFRGGEAGERHRQEFHLIEWYRLGFSLEQMMGEVEQLLTHVHRALQSELPALELRPWRVGPRRRVTFMDLVRETTGFELRGDESAAELAPVLTRVRLQAESSLGLPISADADASRHSTTDGGHSPGEVERLADWTEFFSLWSHLELDPWLRQHGHEGLYVHGFPTALAALSRIRGPVAERFEFHVGDLELANGYRELACGDAQRERFARVNALRRREGRLALPLDDAFFEALRNPGLPDCAGVALGFERMLMALLGCTNVAHVVVDDECV